jgi:hypothetical protein
VFCLSEKLIRVGRKSKRQLKDHERLRFEAKNKLVYIGPYVFGIQVDEIRE